MKDRQNELMGFAEKTITYGSKNVDKIEVYIQDHFEIGGEVNLGQITKATKSQDSGVSIRCVIGKRLGSAFTNILKQETLNQAVDRAIAAAKASTPDKDWKDFPQKSRYPEVKGTWDDAITDKDPADFVIMALDLTKEIATRDKSIIIGEAGTGGVYGWSAYANSNGISISDRVTLAFAYAELVAPTPTGMTPGVFALDVKRTFNLDLNYVVENSVRDVLLAKQTAKGETGKEKIIMANNAMGSLIYYTLIPAIRGENVVRGKSVLAERRGDQVASKVLSITDDGIRPASQATSVFDGEGVPRQTTKVIEQGRLKSFIWDTYWANRFSESSTGNANRNLRTGGVGVQISNLVMPTGTKSLEDMISEMDSGYLIKGLQGAHSSNMETGDYSVVGNPAYRIQDGELTGSVHGLMLAGNVFEFIQKIDTLGSDIRESPIWGAGSLIAPSIRFADIQVVAKTD